MKLFRWLFGRKEDDDGDIFDHGWSEPERQADVRIVITAEALLKSMAYALKVCREAGGSEAIWNLHGKVEGGTVKITDVSTGGQQVAGAHVQATTDYALGMLARVREKGPIVGWGHSHPGFGCFPSGTDESTTKSYLLSLESPVSLIVNPLASGSMEYAFYAMTRKDKTLCGAGYTIEKLEDQMPGRGFSFVDDAIGEDVKLERYTYPAYYSPLDDEYQKTLDDFDPAFKEDDDIAPCWEDNGGELLGELTDVERGAVYKFAAKELERCGVRDTGVDTLGHASTLDDVLGDLAFEVETFSPSDKRKFVDRLDEFCVVESILQEPLMKALGLDRADLGGLDYGY